MTATITSISASGTAAVASGAGVQVANISAATLGAPGEYEFTAYVTLGATGAAADANNVELKIGTSTAVLPVAPVAGFYGPVRLRAVLDGATAAQLLTVGANGNSTVAYYGMLVADYIGREGATDPDLD